MSEVRARADTVLSLPREVTALADTGLVTDVVPLPGRPISVSPDGEILTGLAQPIDGADLGRMVVGGDPVPVDLDYRTYGVAAAPAGGGGDPVLGTAGMAWLASPDTSADLEVLDFVIYAADFQGRSIRELGQSSPDVAYSSTTRNLQVPFGRERLTVVAGRAFWMESVRRLGQPDEPAAMGGGLAYPFGVEVVSAPMDASAPQAPLFAGWHHGEDLCSSLENPQLYYVDSALSQSPDTGVAAIHRAEVSTAGAVTSDAVIWSAPETTEAQVIGAAACGRNTAVSWSRPSDQDTQHQPLLEVRHGSTTSAISGPAGSYFTNPVLTPTALFFVGVGSSIDGDLYAFDLSTGTIFKVFDEPGFYDMLYASRSTIAWMDSSVDNPDGTYTQIQLAGRLRSAP